MLLLIREKVVKSVSYLSIPRLLSHHGLCYCNHITFSYKHGIL